MFGHKKAVLEMPADSAGAGGGAMEYAGFWARLAALLVDSAILTIIMIALFVVLGMVMGGAGIAIANIIYFLVYLLYWPVMESSARQATFGKSLMGLQVTDLDGNRTSFIKSLLRNLGKILSSLIMGIGFLLAAFTGRKQALHDMLASCLVVRTGPSSFLKAIAAAVVALAIAGYGSYYYISKVYLPQTMAGAMKGGGQDFQREMERAMKQAELDMKRQMDQAMKDAKKSPASPPKQAAATPPSKPAPAAPAAGVSAAEYERLLNQPLTGVDKPSSARAGPGIVHVDTHFSDNFWLKVLLPTLPNLDRGRVTVIIDRVLDAGGGDRYDRGSTFEKEFFRNVSLSESRSGVRHFSGNRSVRVAKGTTQNDVQKVDGVLHLTLPLDLRLVPAGSGDGGKQLVDGPVKVVLQSLQGDTAAFSVSGEQENFLGVTGYDAQGAVVSAESSSRSGDQHKVKFRAPVARIEMATASGLLKREYPFSVTRGGTAAAVASAAAPEKPAAVAAAPAKPAAVEIKPVPGKPAVGAQAPARPAPAKPAPTPAVVAQAAPRAAAPAAADRPRAPSRPLAAPPPEAPVVLPTKSPRYNDVMSAVMNRDRAGLAEALDAGMWADRADSNGATALMAAASNGDAAMVQLLLKHGADPNRRGPAGSVIEYANRSGNTQVAGLLKKAGAR